MFDLLRILNLADSISPVYEPMARHVENWNQPATISDSISIIAERAVEILNSVPGITPAHSRDFKSATPIFSLRDGSVIKSYKNPIGVQHIFIADNKGHMVYGGYIEFWEAGYNYAPLYQALEIIKRELK